jgi:ABC-type polysaccharide/polyol phosphate export permease
MKKLGLNTFLLDSSYKNAYIDWLSGIRMYRLWSYLALQEIRQRYRRSTLGPFWITISMSVMILAIGPLYSTIFNSNIADYFLYLASGYVVWNLILNTINDLTDAFLSAEKFIKQIKLPYSVHIFKVIYKNIIIFVHNSLVILFVFLIYPPQSYHFLWLLPFGIILLCLNLIWVGIFVSLFCTRFRDLNQLVSNVMQILFFLTPVLWKIELLKNYQQFENINIFYHMLNVIRGPIINDSSCVFSLLVLFGIAIFGFLFSFLFFSKYRSRISYWI